MSAEIKRVGTPKDRFLQFWPTPLNSPPGKFRDALQYFPDSYVHADETFSFLRSLGFNTDQAGIQVAMRPVDVAVAASALSYQLNSEMMTTIPHYFLTMRPPMGNGKYPEYITRTIASTERPVMSSDQSIIEEYGPRKKIIFFNRSPYYLALPTFPHSNKLRHLFIDYIKKKMGEKSDPLKQEVAILAGIAKNSPDAVDFAVGEKGSIDLEPHGSKAMDLARIGMVLADYGLKKVDTPLFIISTTRLKNKDNKPPQAYILDQLFKGLGLTPNWLGICFGRIGTKRETPTGALLVEVKRNEYKDALERTKDQFNSNVQQMKEKNPELF